MKLIKAFTYALRGVYTFFSSDPNGKLELCFAIIAIATGFVLHISNTEWIAVLLCTAMVISLEMINASIEKLCDMVEPNFHTTIKSIKDIAAGAVLVSAVVSLIIGLIIFLPKIFEQLN
ncbi:diacylglycerol kinase family protein [Terrimonas sp.]|uniref:diacylglycerol kinase family protein n=1 Tax=Terrimonas sp. TaxID=1914338 RepID=UPI001F0BD5B6|nr:diacylglycerol kinase family protein [Terrimonas sp.]